LFPATPPNCRHQKTPTKLTSLTAPEVSGIVALLLERNRKLKPANLRRILTVGAPAACDGRPA